MAIRTNPSIWLGRDTQEGPPASADLAPVDVAVIGAGITGLTTALELKDQGATVAVIERHRVASGTTGHSTAKITSLHGLAYADLIRRRGEGRARLYGEANQAALAHIAALVDRLGIDCAFERADAFTYTESHDRASDIEAEVEAATRLGLPASYTEKSELPYPIGAAVRFADQAHFHPRRYCLALAEAVVGQGSYLVEDCVARGLEEHDDGVVVHTSRGDLAAGQAVIATLLPFVDRGGFFAKSEPIRSYAIAARSYPPPRGMHFSVDTPTRSVRPLRLEGWEGMILGGGSHPTGLEDDPESYYRDLERWARDVYGVDAIDYRWSAQDYVTVDSVPYVGRSPRMARTMVATGFKKWGITNGTAAAMMLADLAGGREHPWLEVYDATRVGGLKEMSRMAKEGVHDVSQLVIGRVTRIFHTSFPEHLAPGRGAVVDVGGRTVGAYREETGNLHAVGLSCTHVGCTVRWNAAETTWDCPCHGSRFTVEGDVIEGPALEALERIPVEDETSTGRKT